MLVIVGVFDRVGVRPDVLFYGIDRDPGPPYGRAWGYWRHNPRHVRLSDGDISGLVQVQIGARSARVAPYDVARARDKILRGGLPRFLADRLGWGS